MQSRTNVLDVGPALYKCVVLCSVALYCVALDIVFSLMEGTGCSEQRQRFSPSTSLVLANICTMLAQRCRRWANIVQMLANTRHVFTGYAPYVFV